MGLLVLQQVIDAVSGLLEFLGVSVELFADFFLPDLMCGLLVLDLLLDFQDFDGVVGSWSICRRARLGDIV